MGPTVRSKKGDVVDHKGSQWTVEMVMQSEPVPSRTIVVLSKGGRFDTLWLDERDAR